jgi:hypothetical protein
MTHISSYTRMWSTEYGVQVCGEATGENGTSKALYSVEGARNDKLTR